MQGFFCPKEFSVYLNKIMGKARLKTFYLVFKVFAKSHTGRI